MNIAIAGIGTVGGFGCGVAAYENALRKRRVGATDRVTINTDRGPAKLPVYRADTAPLTDYIPKRALRRIDHLSRLTLLGAYLALDDAGVLEADHSHMAVAVATGYGAAGTMFAFLDSIIDDGDALASPTAFSNSVHNAAAAHVCINLKATGPSLTVSQFEMSFPSALLSACRWLEEDQVDTVLVGGVDAYCDVMGYCWQEFFSSGADAHIRPLNFNCQSAVAGEGAAFFVLQRSDAPTPYGSIEAIHCGSLAADNPPLPAKALVVLGADGHRDCARHYDTCMPAGTEVTDYTPVYGSLPIGPAYEMAAAALIHKNETAFAATDETTDSLLLKPVFEHRPLTDEKLCCLKVDRWGHYGLITLNG